MCPIINLTRVHDAFVILSSLFAACPCMRVGASCVYICRRNIHKCIHIQKQEM